MLRTLIVTSFGLGKLRPAPGSWGSLPPCILALLFLYFGAPEHFNLLTQIFLVVAASIACVVLGPWCEQKFGGKDPGVVVIDEVAGMALALLFLPVSLATTSGSESVGVLGGEAGMSSYLIILGAYVLFRIFDIIKPQPANLMQQFPAGWGILLDDLVAGVYVNLILQMVLRFALPALIGS